MKHNQAKDKLSVKNVIFVMSKCVSKKERQLNKLITK